MPLKQQQSESTDLGGGRTEPSESKQSSNSLFDRFGESRLGQRPTAEGFHQPPKRGGFSFGASISGRTNALFGPGSRTDGVAFNGGSSRDFGASSTAAFGSTSSGFRALCGSRFGGGDSTRVTKNSLFRSGKRSDGGALGVVGSSLFGCRFAPLFSANSTAPFGDTNCGFGTSGDTGFGGSAGHSSGGSAFGGVGFSGVGACSAPAFGAANNPAFGSTKTGFGNPSVFEGSPVGVGVPTVGHGTNMVAVDCTTGAFSFGTRNPYKLQELKVTHAVIRRGQISIYICYGTNDW